MVKIAIIGIGAIANTYIALIKNKQINGKLVAISSRNSANMQNVIDKYTLNDILCFEDYHALLASKIADMVIICTPHQTHLNIAKIAIKNGVHPLIEKPIDIDLHSAKDFLAFKEKYTDIICGVAFCNRMANGYQKVKQLLDQHALGRLKRASYTMTAHYRTKAYHHSAAWRGTFAAEGGGVLMTQASHQLDILLWLCGVPEKISAFCYQGENRNIEVENEAYIHMEYKNGLKAQFIASSHELPGTNLLEIVGEFGKITLTDGDDLIVTQSKTSETEYANTATTWFGDKAHIEVFNVEIENESMTDFQAKLINNFIQAVESNTQPICSAKEAVNCLQVAMSAYQASRLGKSVLIASN